MSFRSTEVSQPIRNAHADPSVMLIDPSVGLLLDRLLSLAAEEAVNDVFWLPCGADRYRVVFHRRGQRMEAHTGPDAEYLDVVSLLKARAGLNAALRQSFQSGGFHLAHAGRAIDVRMEARPGHPDEHVTLRLLDTTRMGPSLDDLGISQLDQWRGGLNRRQGLCLLCGDGRTGMTTTLDASLRHLDLAGMRVFMASDAQASRLWPPGGETGWDRVAASFHDALRMAERQDAEVMILGEVLNQETAANAIRASDRGMLVVATIRADGIFSAVRRMRDFGVPDSDLRFALRAVLAQTLARSPHLHRGAHQEAEAFQGSREIARSGLTLLSECHYLRDYREVDGLLAMADGAAVTDARPPWRDMVDDGIDKMLAGEISADEMRRLFGSRFEAACMSRGVAPAAR